MLAGLGVTTLAIGGCAVRLDQALAERDRPAALLSFGMAGALDPSLRLGDWVVGSGVQGEGECDPLWRARLSRQLAPARTGLCLGSDRLIADAAEKAQMWRAYGALIVDMESHHVARAAGRMGLPFAVLRCVSDVASHDLPPAMAVAMRPDGSLALGSVLRSVLREPWQMRDLYAALAGFAKAFGLLKAGVRGLRLG